MSEHTGPWRRKSNGNTVLTGWVSPYAERDPIHGDCVKTHDTLPDDAEPLVPQSEVDAAKAELVEAHIRVARLEADLADADAELEDRPSVPVHGTPEALRYAADEIDSMTAGYWSPAGLRAEASRLEVEQRKVDADNAAIEKAAEVLAGFDWNDPSRMGKEAREDYRAQVRALIAAGADFTGLKDGPE